MKAIPKEQKTEDTSRSVLLPGLRQARQRLGLTQLELGELAVVAKGTIWELEVGRRGAYPRTVRRLAKALETEISNLVEE
jgi:transcriptional regulator with XRE-family HTH domain